MKLQCLLEFVKICHHYIRATLLLMPCLNALIFPVIEVVITSAWDVKSKNSSEEKNGFVRCCCLIYAFKKTIINYLAEIFIKNFKLSNKLFEMVFPVSISFKYRQYRPENRIVAFVCRL